ncbi:hypothetical protein UA70_06750 [Raoultella planticola]|nr:hypothetical protein UA70_06750 [Raoultella planticola]
MVERKGRAASNATGTSGSNGGASGADISGYASQIRNAIQSRLYGADLYAGKSCVLHIKLGPDGQLLDIQQEGGDPALCQAALTAAKTARIPKPPSQAVYEKIKDAKLDLNCNSFPRANGEKQPMVVTGFGSFVYLSLLTFC